MVKDIDKLIKDLQVKYNNEYDYSWVDFSQKNIILDCKKHGEFNIELEEHLNGRSCPNCSKPEQSTFDKIKTLHTTLDFSKSIYKDRKTRISVECKEHGSFDITPNTLLDGKGCTKCLLNKTCINKIKSIGFDFDFSKVNYTDYDDPLILTCKEHGDFKTTFRKVFKNRSGCPACLPKQDKVNVSNKEKGYPLFLEKAKEKWGDRFDYSNVNWINMKTSVDIICSIHGKFTQTPSTHIYGSGCLLCSNKEKMTKIFIEKSINKYGDIFDFTKVNYIDSRTSVILIKKESKEEIIVIPRYHLENKTTSVRSMSIKREPVLIEDSDIIIKPFSTLESDMYLYIKENYSGEILVDHKISETLHYHVYLPEKNVGFRYIDLWGESELYYDKKYHYNMTIESFKIGIKLVHVWEDDWRDKNSLIKSIILNNMGSSKTIYARKCVIKEINEPSIVTSFLNANHIQGTCPSKIKIGLYFNDELISLITFGQLRLSLGQKNKTVVPGSFELLRYCNKIGYSVVGGASKLFKYFLEKYKPYHITSYSDRARSDGNLYKTLGFNYVHNSDPCYFYILKNDKNEPIRKHRFGFRKDKLISGGADPNLTEHQIMLNRRCYRIYDSAADKWVLEYPENNGSWVSISGEWIFKG